VVRHELNETGQDIADIVPSVTSKTKMKRAKPEGPFLIQELSRRGVGNAVAECIYIALFSYTIRMILHNDRQLWNDIIYCI
jgi:hypothetical protein